VDTDAFYTYWAMEALVGHWDSYDANTNNFYVYDDPSTGRFAFFPWGIDSVLDSEAPFGARAPVSVIASAQLSHRLYGIEEGRSAYVDRLRTLLDTVWDESAILAEVDRMEAQVEPYVARASQGAWSTAVDTIRDVVQGRRKAIQAEIAGGPPALSGDLRGAFCLTQVGFVSGTFTSVWNDGDWSADGSATVVATWYDSDLPVEAAGVAVGDAGDGTNDFLAVLGQVSADVYVLLYFQFPRSVYGAGELPVDWNTVLAYLYYKDATTDWTVISYVYDGTLTFDQAGVTTGAPTSGSFSVGLWG
jgi:hypothetical protein